MAKTTVVPAASQSTEELKMAPKVTIDVTVSDADMLDYDSKGFFLCFAVEPESFKELSDETFKALSSPSRSAYIAIKDVWEKMKNFDPAGATPGVQFVQQFATGASAYDQIHDLKLKPGLVPFFSRPDKISDRESRGWRKATRQDIVTSRAPEYRENGAGIRTLRMGDGQVESVLMVKDAEQDRTDRIARDKARVAMGSEVEKAATEEVKAIVKGDATPYE